MATPEGKVKDKVKRVLKAHGDGVYSFWPVQTGMGAKTVDCLVCAHGHYAAIETKAPGKKPTPLQDLTLRQVRAAGGATFVIDNVDGTGELEAFLQRAKNAPRSS